MPWQHCQDVASPELMPLDGGGHASSERSMAGSRMSQELVRPPPLSE